MSLSASVHVRNRRFSCGAVCASGGRGLAAEQARWEAGNVMLPPSLSTVSEAGMSWKSYCRLAWSRVV